MRPFPACPLGATGTGRKGQTDSMLKERFDRLFGVKPAPPPPDALERLQRPGNHETRIGELFEGAVRYDGAGPVFEDPLVILAFTNRSGSNLMADYLRQTGKFAGFGEPLNFDQVEKLREEFGASTFPGHMKDLVAARGKPGKAFGIKASWDQLAMLLRWRIPAMFPSVFAIHMERSDLIAQAVSYSIARQSGQWLSHQSRENDGEIGYDAAEIRGYMAGAVESNQILRLVLTLADFPTKHVFYEDLVARPSEVVRDVLDGFGTPKPKFAVKTPRIKRQSDTRNEEFIRRFRAEFDLTAG